MNNSSRVVLNTGFLYGRKIITIIISLYSTRLILDALGVVDYGIFNLIAGVIAMLAFLQSSMAVSTQRFMSYYLGADAAGKQESVFQTSIQLHLIIGLVLVIALEIAGLFLFDGFLNIPEERVATAKMVFHFMVVSTFFTINAVPYDAAITAHEDLFFEALTGISQSILNLGIAIWITFYHGDRLVLYGLLIASLKILIRVVKGIFCTWKYEECRTFISFNLDKHLFREMYSFAGWNLFGALAAIGRSQGTAVVLNLFHGAAINAAYGIANKVSGQIQSFSTLMMKAINPQIMKNEGGKNRKKMLRLSMISSKFGFFMISLLAFPILFEMESLLNLWLKEVPEYAIVFCQLIVIATLANQLTIGLQSGIQATGQIKYYQTIVGSILLLNVPIIYLLLYFDLAPHSVLLTFTVIELIACAVRLIILKKLANLSIKNYIQRVFYKETIPVLASIFTCLLIINNFEFNFRFFVTGFSSSIVYITCIYIFGLCNDEKIIIDKLARKTLLTLYK